MKNYNKVIESIFGPEWESFQGEEKDGCVAVACVLSVMNGVYPSADEIAKHIDIPRGEIQPSLERLHGAGIFHSNFKVKADLALMGKGFSNSAKALANDAHTWNPSKSIVNAWLQIAGIGSGFIYRNYY